MSTSCPGWSKDEVPMSAPERQCATAWFSGLWFTSTMYGSNQLDGQSAAREKKLEKAQATYIHNEGECRCAGDRERGRWKRACVVCMW